MSVPIHKCAIDKYDDLKKKGQEMWSGCAHF